MPHPSTLAAPIHDAARPLHGEDRDYDPLMNRVAEAPFVLLGEASHGTREFYEERVRITRRLILERGCTAVAAEADWPDAYRVNRYVQGRSDDGSADEALEGFRRFPTWMWRNRTVRDFVEWLREYNAAVPDGLRKVGFYGLDLYSLHSSIEAVVDYLDRIDPEAAQRARFRYGCFDHFGEDPQTYGYAASIGASETCQAEVVEQLTELRRRAEEYMRRDGFVAEDECFFADQNARVVRNAERYYRAMFGGRQESWNLRDRHMAETLDGLARHLARHGDDARIAVWEHNSHIGDARATEMGRRGELNLGQLARERYKDRAVLVGFTTYTGTVSAASNWGGPVERKRVRPALDESYEAVFHDVEYARFYVDLTAPGPARTALDRPRLERAIGVIYRPETERISHYFQAQLPRQFDAVVHIDETRAVEPLEFSQEWERGELPDTYPSGM